MVQKKTKAQAAKFDRCVEDVKAKGDDVNAYAVCNESVLGKAWEKYKDSIKKERYHFKPGERINTKRGNGKVIKVLDGDIIVHTLDDITDKKNRFYTRGDEVNNSVGKASERLDDDKIKSAHDQLKEETEDSLRVEEENSIKRDSKKINRPVSKADGKTYVAMLTPDGKKVHYPIEFVRTFINKWVDEPMSYNLYQMLNEAEERTKAEGDFIVPLHVNKDILDKADKFFDYWDTADRTREERQPILPKKVDAKRIENKDFPAAQNSPAQETPNSIKQRKPRMTPRIKGEVREGKVESNVKDSVFPKEILDSIATDDVVRSNKDWAKEHVVKAYEDYLKRNTTYSDDEKAPLVDEPEEDELGEIKGDPRVYEYNPKGKRQKINNR